MMRLMKLTRQRRRLLSVGIVLLWIQATATSYAEPVDDAMRFFESKVRPLLAEKCWGCHAGEKQKGDLRLDSLDAMLTGGESGPAVVAGDVDDSLIIQAIRYESFEMPPTGPLAENEIAILTRWVEQGAVWPGVPATVHSQTKASQEGDGAKHADPRDRFSQEDRDWWAFQPVKRPQIPKSLSSDWPRSDIDHLVLQRMNSEGLEPAEQADRVSLVRRVYLDVTGLPPTPAQGVAFVSDESADAYEKLVDELLDSPTYGEHFARMWLDLVRYADSDGYRADGYRPDAWRYRDYVIKSLNDDKPYDRFVQEQIAADELFPGEPEAQLGLGYLRHWVYEWNIRDAPGQWKTILEDVTDTTADVFMGLGLQCAKCHNHKFDPLLQADYFRLQAFFAPMMPVDVAIATAEEHATHQAAEQAWLTATAVIRDEIATIEAPYRKQLSDQAINRFPEDIQAIARTPTETQTPYEKQLTYLVNRQVEAEYGGLEGAMKSDDKDRVLALKRQLESLQAKRPKPLPIAMSVTDVGSLAPPTVLPKRKAESIEPGFPVIMQNEEPKIEPLAHSPSTTARRATLAKWLTEPSNPLTSRVMANRIWQWYFGRGLAANASDFGRLGETPSHPELLDYLATHLVDSGWSLKSLHRLILLSATYRQSTQHGRYAEQQLIDPQNRFYWRANTRRLHAEQVRDSLLLVSGKLDARAGGAGVQPDVPRRSIYTRMMRNSPDVLMDSFDLPPLFSSNSSRNVTTTPVQSLMLINSDTLMSHARNLAKTVSSEADDLPAQIDRAWWRVFGRRPTMDEQGGALQFIESQTEYLRSTEKPEAGGSIITTAKLPYRDGQAVRFAVGEDELALQVPHDDELNTEEFTVEAFFQLRSIDQGAAVRTMVGKWDGNNKKPGWSFGVTGKGSRRKPQTLVLQLTGRTVSDGLQNRAIFSDQHVEINKPYYTAASVTLAKDGKPGTITFFLKDLSNDDAPLNVVSMEHDIEGGVSNDLPITFGGLTSRTSAVAPFDGLVDDVRLIGQPLGVESLLFTAEKAIASTIGYWQFEPTPGVMENSINDSLKVEAKGRSVVTLTPSEAAFVDFCHSLLNANEFLYVH